MGAQRLTDLRAPLGGMGEWQADQTRRLLKEDAAVTKELRKHGIRHPVADYAEILVCHRLGLRQQPRSNKCVDAVDEAGTRFQIKARRPTDSSPPAIGNHPGLGGPRV